jgi:putative transposase
MPRIRRVVLPGLPHHITQRGIRRFDIFRDSADRQLYIDLLIQASRCFGLRVCAYCLMTNHVHFVAIPETPGAIWKTFHRCHGIYAVKFNLKYNAAGHLFQGRPFSCVLDEAHFWAAMRYVETNPVRAGMVAKAESYSWSSAAPHCFGIEDRLLDAAWSQVDTILNWKEWLRDLEDPVVIPNLRANTLTGRPCGGDDFVCHAEAVAGRRLRPHKRGPKPSVLNQTHSLPEAEEDIRN